jgi:hypothetical protein
MVIFAGVSTVDSDAMKGWLRPLEGSRALKPAKTVDDRFQAGGCIFTLP